MQQFTQLSVFVQQHRKGVGLGLAGILLFLAGMQTGRVTSPYATAHPIIFQDRQCDGGACSGGSLTELQELREEGVQARPSQEQTRTTAQVAGTVQANGEFIASINSDLYHHVSCASAKRIKEENQIWFSSPQDAQSAGYEPSACSREKGYE